MTEKSEDFPLNKLLSDQDKGKLHETMRTPGWVVLYRLINDISLDWAEQVMMVDYSKADNNQQIIYSLLRKQGMRDGIIKLFNVLQVWKKARDRELE